MRRASVFLIITIVLGPTIDRMDTEIRGKTAAVRRDAFIVSQIVAAIGELDDFQRKQGATVDIAALEHDDALADALGATFDYFRAGGQ